MVDHVHCMHETLGLMSNTNLKSKTKQTRNKKTTNKKSLIKPNTMRYELL